MAEEWRLTNWRDMARPIEIDGRLIGPGQPAYIIAEMACTHGGNVATACALVDVAKNAGADAVKLQTFNTARLLGPEHSMYRAVLPLELSEGQTRHVAEHCRERGITFLSTPDQEADADMLEGIGVPAYKIGSGNLRNTALLRHVAAKGKPIILSTGMATVLEVQAAVDAIVLEAGNRDLVLLHCCSQYPSPNETDIQSYGGKHWWQPEAINLRAMDALRTAFGLPVGYSDHSPINAVAIRAAAMGACVIERHIRPDNYRGLDWAVSATPVEFEAMVRAIRTGEAAMGDGVKRPQDAERATREFVDSWRRG